MDLNQWDRISIHRETIYGKNEKEKKMGKFAGKGKLRRVFSNKYRTMPYGSIYVRRQRPIKHASILLTTIGLFPVRPSETIVEKRVGREGWLEREKTRKKKKKNRVGR